MMQLNTMLAASALLVGAVRAQVGQASVLNLCPQTVYLANTPSADGIHNTDFATLETGQSYEQTYTQLANDNGWSLKLGYSPSLDDGNIMQYEYTYQGEGVVWFDLSKVNGNPFGWFWNISSSNDACTVSQRAYLFPEDNSAMQPSCPDSTDVQVILCQWPSLLIADQNGGTWSPSAWAAPATTSPTQAAAAPTTTTTTPPPAAPTTTTTQAPVQAPPAPPTSAFGGLPFSSALPEGVFAPGGAGGYALNQVAGSGTPTTLATSTTPAASPVSNLVQEDDNGDVAVVWVTDIVTEHVTFTTTQDSAPTPPVKRHEHHAHAHAHANF